MQNTNYRYSFIVFLILNSDEYAFSAASYLNLESRFIPVSLWVISWIDKIRMSRRRTGRKAIINAFLKINNNHKVIMYKKITTQKGILLALLTAHQFLFCVY